MLVISLVLVGLVGCSPHSLEDYQYEGEAQARALVKELKKIHTREELSSALPKLKKQFHQFVQLMIQAKEFQLKHPEYEEVDPAYFDHTYTEALKTELVRVCKLEGGREMIEKAQREALIQLDGFDKALRKKRTQQK